jgi:hypothetical protein
MLVQQIIGEYQVVVLVLLAEKVVQALVQAVVLHLILLEQMVEQVEMVFLAVVVEHTVQLEAKQILAAMVVQV